MLISLEVRIIGLEVGLGLALTLTPYGVLWHFQLQQRRTAAEPHGYHGKYRPDQRFSISKPEY